MHARAKLARKGCDWIIANDVTQPGVMGGEENAVLLLLGLVLLALTAARLFALSTLLVPLLAGVMLRNASDRPCIWPRHFGTAGGVLVLMLFVIVGAAWSVETLAVGIVGALLLLGVRALSKSLVLVGMARVSGIEARQGLALAMSLTPVSATSLILLAELQATHPTIAAPLMPLIAAKMAQMATVPMARPPRSAPNHRCIMRYSACATPERSSSMAMNTYIGMATSVKLVIESQNLEATM